MKALVVINPIAGPGRRRSIGACVDLAQRSLSAHRYETDVRITTGPHDAVDFTRDAVARQFDLVVVWGGDGTVNSAASILAGTNIPLAIIPGGSGNGLARDLLIPLDAAGAFEIAADGATRRIDAGVLNGALFVNVAGIGFDARIAVRLAVPGARRGLLGYVLATMGELRTYEPGRYSIHDALDVNGRSHMPDIVNHPAMFIALANSRQYGNGAQIAPKALLDDGLIEIVIVEPQSVFRIMKQVPAFFRGTLVEGAGIVMRSAAAMSMSSAHPIQFHVDGEPREGTSTIRLETRRHVLPVRVKR
jgi:YegS/Rv2252/BmrU family lipid kinase